MEFTPKRDIAKQFLTLIGRGEIDKAFANYTATSFKHHHPSVPAGKEALKEAMKNDFTSNPTKKTVILRLIEQNDLVMAHSYISHTAENREYVVVHIFRFSDHLITELWDIVGEIPKSMINKDGAY